MYRWKLLLYNEDVILFILMANKTGPRTEPWGTPFVMGRKEDLKEESGQLCQKLLLNQ